MKTKKYHYIYKTLNLINGKYTVELWHPDAPTCASNRNSPHYVCGWSVRVKPLSEKHFLFLEMGYTQRISTSDIIGRK